MNSWTLDALRCAPASGGASPRRQRRSGMSSAMGREARPPLQRRLPGAGSASSSRERRCWPTASAGWQRGTRRGSGSPMATPMEWRPGCTFPAALLQRRRMTRRALRLLAVEERQPGRTEVVVPGSGEWFPSSVEAWKMRLWLRSCLIPSFLDETCYAM
jgi:hypothetical protein